MLEIGLLWKTIIDKGQPLIENYLWLAQTSIENCIQLRNPDFQELIINFDFKVFEEQAKREVKRTKREGTKPKETKSQKHKALEAHHHEDLQLPSGNKKEKGDLCVLCWNYD